MSSKRPAPHGIHTDSERGYRQSIRPREGEVAFQAVVQQSDLWIVASKDLRREASEALYEVRRPLAAYMELHPNFAHSLTAVEVAKGAPEIAHCMARAAAACGVGPMAAVAGAVARRVADRLALLSPEVLVENGGDCYLRSSRARRVALLADPGEGSALGLQLDAADFPLALCASSSTIGHSLSLGRGELVVVRSQSACLADAAATALCNLLRGKADLPKLVEAAKRLADLPPPGRLDGVFAQCGGQITVWGKMELTAL